MLKVTDCPRWVLFSHWSNQGLRDLSAQCCTVSETSRCRFQGSTEFWHHSLLCLNAELSKRKLVGEKRFTRIGRFWDLQVGEREMLHPENLVGYSFITKGKVGSGRRISLSFLSRHLVSIISSSLTQGSELYLSLPIWLGWDCHSTLEKYFQVSVQWDLYNERQYNEGLSFWKITFP